MDLLRDYYKRSLKLRPDSAPRVLAARLYREFKDSQKFVLPINGRILDNGGEALGEDLRLPFPAIILEFESELDPALELSNLGEVFENMDCKTNVFDRHIVFATQDPDTLSIEIQCASRVTTKPALKYVVPLMWQTYPYKMVIDNKRTGDDKEIVARILPTHEIGLNGDFAKTGDWRELGLAMLKPAFKALAELLEALECSNIQALKSPSKKKALGRRPGELPYDDYHELVVWTRSGKRTVGQSTGGKSPDGDPRKKREHLRRGHIRRYPDRKIFIQNIVVNPGVAGKVTKHYSPKKAK